MEYTAPKLELKDLVRVLNDAEETESLLNTLYAEIFYSNREAERALENNNSNLIDALRAWHNRRD